MNTNKYLEIYTDGACSGNPGPGGWGVVLIWDDIEKKLSGYEELTTNNRMELKAAIEGLKSIKREVPIKIYTDSQYVKNGITLWMPKWLRSDWKNGKIKNVDLWQELNSLVHRFSIEWHWVRGHAGDKYNEMADELARNAIYNNLVK
jgi:ribonuclease HI